MSGPEKLMLVRHAEKPIEGVAGVDENGATDKRSLIPRGWQRAGALVRFFAEPFRERIAVPNVIFAAGVSSAGTDDESRADGVAANADTPFASTPDDAKSFRSVQTVTPLARRLQQQPDTSFTVGDEERLIEALQKQIGTVLVAWEHKRLSIIAEAFIKNAPQWDSKCFDLVWILDKKQDGTYDMRVVAQDILEGDMPAPRPSLSQL